MRRFGIGGGGRSHRRSQQEHCVFHAADYTINHISRGPSLDGFPAFEDKRQKIFRELLPCAHERMTAPIAPADVPCIVAADLCPELVKGCERHDGVVVAGGEKHLPVRKRRGGVRKTHGGGMGVDVVHDRAI